MAVVQFKPKDSGFAMNSRAILSADWYKNINARLIYLELSLRVCHSRFETTFNGHDITLNKGEYITKLENLAKAINGTKDQARHAVRVLEKHGVITKTTIGKAKNKCTLIKLNSDTSDYTQATHARPQKQRTVNKVAHKPDTRTDTLNQEVSKSIINNTYVQNASALLVSQVQKLFNESFDELSAVVKITQPRKSRLIKIFKDYPDFKKLDHWKGFFEYIRQSDFLMGRYSDWKMTFDWMIKPANFLKIIEGNYENK